MKDKIKIFKDTFYYSLGTIVPQFLNFLLLPLFTRYLSPEDYGIINYTNSIVMFIVIISTLSLNTYLLRYYFEQKSLLLKKQLIGNIFLFILGMNIILLLLSFTFGAGIFSAFRIKVPFYPYFFLALCNNFFNVLAVVPMVIFRVQRKAALFVAVNCSRVILQSLLSLFLIISLKWGVLGRFYGELYVNLGFGALFLLIVFRHAVLN
ncbi:MAG: oligosaccharide flippase family protein, partial [Spirochaetes bacterium]|nr:oligosaccharide flippase family protein [Spirochaetota bacterium]